MSLIQSVLNEFMPCGGSVCRGCEVECAHGGHINGGRTPDVNSMADALIEAREQRDALRTQLAAARTVIEAAKAWEEVEILAYHMKEKQNAEGALVRAVDALRAVEGGA